jgi:hypothetical protein
MREYFSLYRVTSIMVLGAFLLLPGITSIKPLGRPWVPGAISFLVLASTLVSKSVTLAKVFFIWMFFVRLAAKYPISIKKAMLMLNAYYVCYVAASLLSYFDVFAQRGEFSFSFELLGYSLRTFVGLSGSTAAIDYFSGFVLLANLLYSRRNLALILLALVIMAWTTRLTPLFGFVGVATLALVEWILRRNSGAKVHFRTAFCISVSLFPILLLFFLTRVWNSPALWSFFTSSTSGRIAVWPAYINEFLDTGDKIDYLLGMGRMPALNVKNLAVAHPHNNYLYFLFLHGIAGVSMVVGAATFIVRKLDTRGAMVATYLLLSAVSNDYVLFYGNMIVYLFIAQVAHNSNHRTKELFDLGANI